MLWKWSLYFYIWRSICFNCIYWNIHILPTVLLCHFTINIMLIHSWKFSDFQFGSVGWLPGILCQYCTILNIVLMLYLSLHFHMNYISNSILSIITKKNWWDFDMDFIASKDQYRGELIPLQHWVVTLNRLIRGKKQMELLS